MGCCDDSLYLFRALVLLEQVEGLAVRGNEDRAEIAGVGRS
jgi:hypothetical protein